jgi:hypothetical protein
MFVVFENLTLGGFSVGTSGTGQLQLNLPTLNVLFGSTLRVRNAQGVDLLVGTFAVG